LGRGLRGQLLDEIADLRRVRALAARGPDQLVLLEAVHEDLDVDDRVRAQVAGIVDATPAPAVIAAAPERGVTRAGIVGGGARAQLLLLADRAHRDDTRDARLRQELLRLLLVLGQLLRDQAVGRYPDRAASSDLARQSVLGAVA